MAQTYILAIDEGTTSTRAILFDQAGQKCFEEQKEFTQYFPQPGWVEHDANEIWNAVQSTLANLFINSGVRPDQVEAIGITNQRETAVVWDKTTGLPIYHAIVWQSRQTADLAQDLVQQGFQSLIHQKTGLVVDAYFSATKIRWLLDRIPEAQHKAEMGQLLFGTIDTWLLWKLTGGKVHVTDCSNASRTMLFNIHEGCWDQDILDLMKIPKQMLPQVADSSQIYGYTADYHFFGATIPIAGIAGDQQAALFGQLAWEAGEVKNTYGTGAFIVMNTGDQPIISQHQLLTTVAYRLNGKMTYALEGSIFVAGSALQWLRDKMGLLQSAPDSEAAAYRSTSQDEIYVVPAFTGLGAPYWDSDARGAIFGLTRGTDDADIIKATLQSLAYQTRDVVATMIRDTGLNIPVLRVDGGASMNTYLLQFQADILGVPIERAINLETTALGVAFLAGLAVGYWQDMASIKQLYQAGQRFEGRMTDEERERLYQGWQQAVAATRYFAQQQQRVI